MVKAVKVYTAICLVFLVILGLSGSFSSIINNIVYVSAFALPLIVGLMADRKLKTEREEIAGVAEKNKYYIAMKKDDIASYLALIMPSVFLIFVVAYITNFILSLTGAENSDVPLAPLYEMLIVHAILPSLLEESLFRYMPMKLISPYSKKACVILSSLYFAFIHCNFFQIPYALLAGFIFITIDLMYDSVLPSLILHLFNNSMSVLFIKYGEQTDFRMIFIFIILILAFISTVFIVAERRKYREKIKYIFKEDNSAKIGYYPLLVAVPTLLMAFLMQI